MNKTCLRLLFCIVTATGCINSAENNVTPKHPVAPKRTPPVVVTMSTSLGNIEIRLDAEKAPVSVSNFLAYVDAGYYDGIIFHRVIPGFMIQGGGVDANMMDKPLRPPIKNEAANGLLNKRGTVAMARMPEVDSATSQFFINLQDNPQLNNGVRDFGYAVFGEVISGMETVDKIAAVPTGIRNEQENVPLTPVIINTMRRK